MLAGLISSSTSPCLLGTYKGLKQVINHQGKKGDVSLLGTYKGLKQHLLVLFGFA